MLVGIGDGTNGDFLSFRAQRLDEWSGKILRLNDDGTAPGDNPFDDGTQSIRSKVWVYGLRNPFRFSVQPGTNVVLFGDVGWNTWEEVNRGLAGANFGWPCYEGNLPEPFFNGFAECQALPPSSVTQPILTYGRSVGSAAIGGTIFEGAAYPESYRGSYFFADYVGSWIRRVVFDANGNPISFPYFATNVPFPATIELGPDGNLYYISFSTGQIRRIRYNGPSAVASASPTSGYSPLEVSFSSSGSVDPNGQPLTYSWAFGDGTTSTAPNPTHTYTASGVTSYTATLTVRTTTNATSSAAVTVTVGSQPPTATILAPGNGTLVAPGQTIIYQGQASDPDEGGLPSSSLEWTILLHHNTHVHTYLQNRGSSQGSFVAEDHGVGNFSYELILSATDSSGLIGRSSVLLPVMADTTPPTPPGNLNATALSNSQINLSWSASTDNGTVLGYHVERCQGVGCSDFAHLVTTGGTSYSNLSLLAATTYRYRVQAVDATGNLSGYSTEATATTLGAPDTTAPTVPGGLTATAVSSSQINVSWTASTDAVGVTGYRVERCQGAGCTSFVQVATPTGTSYSDPGLLTATTYGYRVRAGDAAGNLSGYSNEATATTLAGPPPISGLVAAYNFDEGSGVTVADASGNGNTGTINGASWTPQGKYGSALSFDGVNDLVAITGSASLNVSTAMTLEGWIYPTATQSGWRTILQREVDAYFLNASNGGGALYPAGGGTFGGSVGLLGGPTANPVGTWTHVALTYDGSELQLYVNGTSVADAAVSGTIETNSSPLRIGGNAYGEFFNGRIDDVRVYNRALSQAEIVTDMNTPVSAGPPDTTAPTVPGGLTATAVSSSQINVSADRSM
jgi:PKD repeat protein